jgi:hypothetical protein
LQDHVIEQQLVCWVNTLQQLSSEHAAAVKAVKAAGKLMAAAKWLAPRLTRRPAHELQVRWCCNQTHTAHLVYAMHAAISDCHML